MQHKYNIELIRFTTTGSYFDTITFATDSSSVWSVSGDIKAAYSAGDISQDYDYMITGKGFPDDTYPALLNLATDRKHLKTTLRYLSMKPD